jgi:hypothetical protein
MSRGRDGTTSDHLFGPLVLCQGSRTGYSRSHRRGVSMVHLRRKSIAHRTRDPGRRHILSDGRARARRPRRPTVASFTRRCSGAARALRPAGTETRHADAGPRWSGSDADPPFPDGLLRSGPALAACRRAGAGRPSPTQHASPGHRAGCRRVSPSCPNHAARQGAERRLRPRGRHALTPGRAEIAADTAGTDQGTGPCPFSDRR